MPESVVTKSSLATAAISDKASIMKKKLIEAKIGSKLKGMFAKKSATKEKENQPVEEEEKKEDP